MKSAAACWRTTCRSSPAANGPSIHTGDELTYSSPGHKALGSRVLFHIPLELGIQVTPNNRVALYYEHASNGFTAYPNPGMDNIGVRLAHRF